MRSSMANWMPPRPLSAERRIAADPELAAEYRSHHAPPVADEDVAKPQSSNAFLERIAAIGERPRKWTRPASVQPVERQTQSTSSTSARTRTSWSLEIPVVRVACHGCLDCRQRGTGKRGDAMGDDQRHVRQLRCRSGERPSQKLAGNKPCRCRLVGPAHRQALAERQARPIATGAGSCEGRIRVVGGRVEVIGNRPVPALVYRHNEHLITLVAQPQNGGCGKTP